MKRQVVKIVMRLPEGEDVKEAPDFVEWLMKTKMIAKAQGIECAILVDGQEIEIDVVPLSEFPS